MLFETRWLSLLRRGRWDYVKRPHSDACVGILALTPERELVLVEQERIPVRRPVIEIPAGLVGDEPEFAGESLADSAARELLEETGYRAGRIRHLIASPTSAGMTSEFVHLFFADQLAREHAGGGVAGENIRVHLVPLAGVRAWLAERQAEGMAVDFKIHAALWQAAPWLEAGARPEESGE